MTAGRIPSRWSRASMPSTRRFPSWAGDSILKGFALSLVVFALMTSCHSNSGHETHEEIKKVVYDEAPEDFKIPKVVWDVLDTNDAEPTAAGVEVPDQENIFLPAELTLKEKNEGVLKNPKIELSYGRGGGQLDLAHWMGPEVGSFHLKFNLDLFAAYPSLKVYFLSKAKKRRLDDEVLGVGCNKLIEITQKFKQAMAQEGLTLNNTRDRHLTVTTGHYFFVARENKKKYITQIEVTDSGKKNLFCDESGNEIQ